MKLRLPVITIHSAVHCTLKQGTVQRVLVVSENGTNPNTDKQFEQLARRSESQVTQHR